MKDKLGKAPIDPIIFIDEQKKKEWDELPRETKIFIKDHLFQCVRDMGTTLSIEMLVHVINDLSERISKLEEQ